MRYAILLACLGALFPLSFAVASPAEYIFILKGRDNPYWTVFVDGIRNTPGSGGAVIYQIENDRAAEEQLDVCLTAVERHPRFLAIAAVNLTVGLECLNKAADEGITIADLDANISVKDATKKATRLAYSVGSDNFLIGQKAADYLKSIETRPAIKVFILEGAHGSIVGQERVDGFKSELKSLIPLADVTASFPAEWDREKAMSATADMLTRTPDLDVIFAANDTMALGAVDAVRAVGKGLQVKIIGVDGTADARDAIRSGSLMASVARLPFLMGKRAMELAIETGQRGGTGPKGRMEIIPTPVITKALMESQNDPNWQYVR